MGILLGIPGYKEWGCSVISSCYTIFGIGDRWGEFCQVESMVWGQPALIGGLLGRPERGGMEGGGGGAEWGWWDLL